MQKDSLKIFQTDATNKLIITNFANHLQYSNSCPEETNVKNRQFKVNEAKVSSAVCKIFPTCFTVVVFLTCSLQKGINKVRNYVYTDR